MPLTLIIIKGHNRREVLTGLSHPYGITVLDSYLYWTDWETKSLQRADKNTALDRSTIRVGLDNLMDIKAWKVTTIIPFIFVFIYSLHFV